MSKKFTVYITRALLFNYLTNNVFSLHKKFFLRTFIFIHLYKLLSVYTSIQNAYVVIPSSIKRKQLIKNNLSVIRDLKSNLIYIIV